MDKYFVIKKDELSKHTHRFSRESVEVAVKLIELARAEKGKKPNSYIVINRDEPYADQVIQIMKQHGHDIND